MTPASISGAVIILSLVVGMPIPTNAEPVKVVDETSIDGSFIIAQTNEWTAARIVGAAGRTAASRQG